MVDISRLLFLVDGSTEIRAFREKFKKDFGVCPALRKVDCNGKSVTPDGYADKALPIIQLGFSGRFSTFFCILDLENRSVSPDAFSELIANAINDRLRAKKMNANIIVAVPNRMFENWIVSDIAGLKINTDLILHEIEQCDYDGKSGVTILKRSMVVPYKKTFHGWLLFKKTSFENSKVNSPSFRKFADILDI